MKLNLESIIIFVKNIEQLKCFYTDILKFEIVEDSIAGWLLLQAGSCKIGLHQISDEYLNAFETTSENNNNIKLVFETNEDIQKIRAKLLSENVLMKEIKTFENYDFWLCDGEDPEGNVFQIKQKKN